MKGRINMQEFIGWMILCLIVNYWFHDKADPDKEWYWLLWEDD